MSSTGIAIVGCGFVADYYLATIEAYPRLTVRGVFDKNPERLKQFCTHYQLNAYASFQALLADKTVDIVLNLTDPRSHYEISKTCLNAGKHVYSEKPLAMSFEDARELVDLAKARNLSLSGAPCSALGKSARTLAHAVKTSLKDDVKLVYAELEDGLVHKMAYKKWFSASGAPWPYRDEFEVGCTLEHAGYAVSWLLQMFGPVKSVTAFSDCLVPNKVPKESALRPSDTADASFGILKFHSGVVARLSTTIVAPHDHAIRLFGDRGVVEIKECWDNNAPVTFRRLMRIRRKTFLNPFARKVRLPEKVDVNKMHRGNTRMDFLLGVDALAGHVKNGETLVLNADFSLHVSEIALALQYAGEDSSTYYCKSRF